MSQHIIAGEPAIHVVLRRSVRARRLSLRVSRLDGRVTLTMPQKFAQKEALAFAYEKQDWLRIQLQKRPDQVLISHGENVLLQGVLYQIVQGEGRKVTISGEARIENGPAPLQIAVPGPQDRVAARLKGFLRQRARDELANASDHYAERLGIGYTRITMRDTRSRWGSCSSARALMYSWRLIMAPPEVLDYVAAHEVAHLAEMNHSDAFWNTVERIHGPYQEPRGWLRAHGETLHRFRFGD